MRRTVAALAVLTCLVLAGCGSSGPAPSGLDPARVAPANAIAYVELTVRPQGAQRDAAEGGLTKLLGHSPDAGIQRAVDHALRNSGLRYKQDIEPWLGQHVGFVATGFSRAGIAFIAPTNDPSAAVSALERGARRHGPLVNLTYAGVTYKLINLPGGPIALGAVGHYAVIGGASAFKQIVDASRGSSLAQQPSFSTQPQALARAYVDGPRAVAAVMALPQLRSVLAHVRLPTALALSVSISRQAFTVDARAIGAPAARTTAGGADVSTLPLNSWFALSTGSSFSRQFTAGFNAGFIQGFGRALRARGISPATVLQQFRQRTGIDLVHDLLPALGPFQLAVQGGTLTTLAATLALHPTDPAAGARLVGDIYNLVARSHSLRVTGGTRSFTFTPASTPIPRVAVSDLGRAIFATFEILAAPPASAGKLGANSTFIRARSQLPPGSRVPLFLDFGPLASLLSQTPQFKPGGRDHNALAVLRRLDYFVIGTSSAEHDLRVVLGLH